MTNYCKDICVHYRHTSKGKGYTARYANGAKFCKTCQIYLVWEGSLICPCCGQHLRTRPRKAQNKLKYKKLLIALQTK